MTIEQRGPKCTRIDEISGKIRVKIPTAGQPNCARNRSNHVKLKT